MSKGAPCAVGSGSSRAAELHQATGAMRLFVQDTSIFIGCMLVLTLLHECLVAGSMLRGFPARARRVGCRQEEEVVDSSLMWADAVLVKMREQASLGPDWMALTELLVQEERFQTAWQVLMSFATHRRVEPEEQLKARALLGLLVVRMYRLEPHVQSLLLHRDAFLACGRILWFCVADSEELVCVLCTNLPLAPALLPCGHFFCFDCLHRWLEEAKKLGDGPGGGMCPYCRGPLRAFTPAVDKPLEAIMRMRARAGREGCGLIKE